MDFLHQQLSTAIEIQRLTLLVHLRVFAHARGDSLPVGNKMLVGASFSLILQRSLRNLHE